MNERLKFVAAMLEAEEPFGELCERSGISRKHGYEWKERYDAGGVEALADRFRSTALTCARRACKGRADGKGAEEVASTTTASIRSLVISPST